MSTETPDPTFHISRLQIWKLGPRELDDDGHVDENGDQERVRVCNTQITTTAEGDRWLRYALDSLEGVADYTITAAGGIDKKE